MPGMASHLSIVGPAWLALCVAGMGILARFCGGNSDQDEHETP